MNTSNLLKNIKNYLEERPILLGAITIILVAAAIRNCYFIGEGIGKFIFNLQEITK